jgi:hypothetical protein
MILSLFSCKANKPLENRTFQMGAMYWKPPQASDTLIKQAVQHMLDNSEILTAQIQWTPFDTNFSGQVKWMADLAHEHKRAFIVSMDWLTDSRSGLRDEGWNFAQATTQQRFLQTAIDVCKKYHPDYLNLGVEVNFYALTNPQDFRAYIQTYNRAKALINERFPEIIVSATLQLELLFGTHADWDQKPSLEVLHAFGDNFDILALSTYPGSNAKEFNNYKALDSIIKLTNRAGSNPAKGSGKYRARCGRSFGRSIRSRIRYCLIGRMLISRSIIEGACG